MEKVNIGQVFETLNEQRRKLNHCLGLKGKTYQQILSNKESWSLVQALNVVGNLKTAQQLLNADEYEKLWKLSKLSFVAEALDNILFTLKYGTSSFFTEQDAYMFYKDKILYVYGRQKVDIGFLILTHGKESNVFELIVSSVMVRNKPNSLAEDKAFSHFAEVEFVAKIWQDKCFIVHIVPSILENDTIKNIIAHRHIEVLSFSKLRVSHIRTIQRNMFELKKKLMLLLEVKFDMLFPEKLGKINLISLPERFPSVSVKKWRYFLVILLNRETVFSRKMWRRLYDMPVYSNVFYSVKWLLQRFNADSHIEKNVVYSYFFDREQKVALRFFWRHGWMVQVFVENKMSMDFPVISGNFVYFICHVPSLRQEPLLEDLFDGSPVHYIWP